MTLYDDLSVVYDIVFPENRQATGFLAKGFDSGGRILDLACGTGNYTHALTQKGHDVYGIDLDELMIQAAKRKYPDKAGNFFTGDMLNIDSIFEGQSFDMIYCIGNSLVHLPNKEAIRKLTVKVFDLLNDNGMFIIQVVNYDKIVRDRIESLPPIVREKEGVSFIRNYTFENGREFVNFNTELRYDNEKIANSVKLLALQSMDLTDMVKSAGFTTVQLFGSYDEPEYTANSNATIIKATKLNLNQWHNNSFK